MHQGWASAALPGTALRLLTEEEEDAAAAKALEVDRIRQSYSTVLEGFIRMNALQAKQEATLQALKGGLVRRELSSQVKASRASLFTEAMLLWTCIFATFPASRYLQSAMGASTPGHPCYVTALQLTSGRNIRKAG